MSTPTRSSHLSQACRPATWLDCVHDFARAHDVDERWTDVLTALASPRPRGGPPPPPERRWTGSFEDLERATWARPGLPELDVDQRQVFYRRIDVVLANLKQLQSPQSRVLAVGLQVRLAGMAEAPGPQGVRVRALADFYYSQLAQVLHLQSGSSCSLAQAAQAIHWRQIATGLFHAQLDHLGPMGPMFINMLRIDPERYRMEAIDLRSTDGDLAQEARKRGALAATSGGFFLYSEPDITSPSTQGDPVGLWIGNSTVVNPPFLPRGALLAGSDWVDVGVISVEGAFTRANGKIGPASDSVAMIGTEVVATGTSLPVPLNGAILPQPVQGPYLYRHREITNAVAGGPMLLRDGALCIDLRSEGFWGTAPPVTFSQDETGDRNLLPRLAAGIHRDGSVILAAIDGRNIHRALGMTLAQTATWMQLLGCDRAVNLDGGSSKRMVVAGREVDLSTTEIRVDDAPTPARPVRTGVFWFRKTDRPT